MKLKELYAMWLMSSENEIIVTDKENGKVYDKFYQIKEIWNRDVVYFYFVDNNLYIRIK